MESTGFPLSDIQRRIWFALHAHSSEPWQWILANVRLGGSLDSTKLQSAIDVVTARHEALRVDVRATNGSVMQRVVAGRWSVLQVIHGPQPGDVASNRTYHPDGLDRYYSGLSHFTLRRSPAGEDTLGIALHPLVGDHQSIETLIHHTAQAYTAICEGSESVLAGSAWAPSSEPKHAAHSIDRWIERLGPTFSEVRRVRELDPTDLDVRRQRFDLSPSGVRALRSLAEGTGYPAESCLLAAYALVVEKLSGHNNGVSIGSAVREANAATIGPHTDFLPFLFQLPREMSFRDLIRGAVQWRELASNHLVTARQLTSALGLSHVKNPSPLCDASFAYRHRAAHYPAFFQTEITAVSINAPPLGAAPMLDVNDDGSIVSLDIVHSQRASSETALWMQRELEDTLARGCRGIDRSIDEVRKPHSSLSNLLSSGWNATDAILDEATLVHQKVEEQANRRPTAVALELDGATLTYGELNARANRLAHLLVSHGVVPETRVAIFTERSFEMVVSLLAVLKAGGAYLPLDAEHPDERLSYIIRDAAPAMILTDAVLAARARSLQENVKVVVCDSEIAHDFPSTDLRLALNSQSAVYLIYTSGSTGQPKGVVVTHRSLANYVCFAARDYDIRTSDKMLQFASFGWDTAGEEIYPTLISGATLVLRHRALTESFATFSKGIERASISCLNLPTAFWTQLCSFLSESGSTLPGSLRLMVIGGEKLTSSALSQWALLGATERVRLVNTYGATETTAVTTLAEVTDASEASSFTIGKPVTNVKTYVLNPGLQPVPVGTTGVLYVGGPGVARGYWTRPDLTAERFLPDPFCSTAGARMYCTGDVARYSPDGALEYIGRRDDQVKIRGARVELAEVEKGLLRCPGVAACVAVAPADPDGSRRLVAYVVMASGAEFDVGMLRAHAEKHLAHQFVPSFFVHLDQMPLNTNGKVDRAALPAVYASVRPPPNSYDAEVAHAISELIGTPEVDRDSNLFALGMDSLQTIELVARLNDLHGRCIDVLDVYLFPTARQLALRMRERLVRQRKTSPSTRRNSHWSEDEILSEVTAIVASTLDIAPAGSEANLFHEGLDSLRLMRLLAVINQRFEVNLGGATVRLSPTTAAISREVYARRRAPATLVPPTDTLDERSPVSRHLGPVIKGMASEPGLSPVNNLVDVYRFAGSFDVEAFVKSAKQLISDHESLRTQFEFDETIPFQRVTHTTDVDVVTYDFAQLSPSDIERRLREIAAEEHRTTFNWTTSPRIRFRVCEVSEEAAAVIVVLDHAVGDDASLQAVFEDLMLRYRANVLGESVGLPQPPQQRSLVRLEQRLPK